MIEGGWAYVWGAYGLAVAALVALSVMVALRLAYWAKRAKEDRN